MPSDAFAWAAGLGLLGAILGSFLATLAVRWVDGRTIGGRSACDGCGRTLHAVELIPIVGALALHGRCRTCGAAIDPLHLSVELACLAIGASAGWVAPGAGGLAGAAFGWLLATLAAIDWRAFWLPDRLVAPLALVGLAGGLAGIEPPLADRLIGGAVGFLLLFAVAAAYRRLRGRAGMGGGDPKLFGAIGLALGWRLLPAVIVVAGLVGLGLVAFRASRGQAMAADAALPLGTLLAIAAYPAWWMMIASAP